MLAVMPALMFMLALPIQAGCAWWVSLAARHAANTAANEAGALDGSDAAATDAAVARLHALVPGLVDGVPRVTIRRSASTVEVRVSTRISHMIPGLFDHASATEVEPMQRFVPAGEP